MTKSLTDLLSAAKGHVAADRKEAAIDVLEEVLAREPEHGPARQRLARLYEASGNVAAAARHWQALVELSGGHAVAHRWLARFYQASGELDSAIAHLRALLKLPGDHVEAHTRLARLHEVRGDSEAAVHHWRELLELSGNHVEAHTRLARLHEGRSEKEPAIEHFEALLELPGDHGIAHTGLARLHESRGDTATAIEHWRAVLELPGDHATAHASLARLHEERGDTAAAIGSWQAVLELPERASLKRRILGRCLPQVARDYPRACRVVRVDAGGQAEFASIQGAVDSTMGDDDGSRVEIQIAPGRYRERVVIPDGAPPLSLRGMGETAEEVIIESDLASDDPLAADEGSRPERTKDFRAATLLVVSDDHIVSNLAVVNSRVKLFNEKGGLPAARVDGDRVTFIGVIFLNWGPDVLAAVWGRQYYHKCRIEARDRGTDFIYGTARALFHGCLIRVAWSRAQLVAHARSGAKRVHTPEYAELLGRVSGPREERSSGGFVFSRCRFEPGPGSEVFLGRPYRGEGRIIVLNSWLGEGIRPEGWTDRGKPEGRASGDFAEFGNEGPGADTSRRVAWARQLDESEVAEFDSVRFLRDPEGRPDAWLGYVWLLNSGQL